MELSRSLAVAVTVLGWTATAHGQGVGPADPFPPAGAAPLTLSAEARLRWNVFDNDRLVPGDDHAQALLRGVVGADLRLHPDLRVFAEVGVGEVHGRRDSAAPSSQNDLSLQQLFLEARHRFDAWLVGARVGRQEFSDGPRQLISLGDGPNLHRTWNGARAYVQGRRLRLGAFDLRATRLGSGAFDEEVDEDVRLQGLNASVNVSADPSRAGLVVDPFWLHSEDPAFRAGAHTGRDERDTFGARVFGRRGRLRFDWTAALQTGEFEGRDVEAWGLFAVQSVELSDEGWRPRLTSHIDVASGGGMHGEGPLRAFHPLYSSSGYLGEGRLLSLSNLVLAAPGIALSPTPKLDLSAELGFARRFTEDDAVVGGGLRAYPRTDEVSGHGIGRLLRIAGNWRLNDAASLAWSYEHLAAGDVLDRAGLPSGRFAFVSLTLRY